MYEDRGVSAPTQEQPSWLPYMSKETDFRSKRRLWQLFRACKDFKPNVVHCGDGMLAVTGLNIDTVAFVGGKLEVGGELYKS